MEQVAEVQPPPPPVNKFKCAGARRKPPQCDYQAPAAWPGRCPKCRQPYDCMAIKGAEDGKKFLTAASAKDFKPPEYISTGISEYDDVTGGGVVLGNVVLLKGEKGKGKTSMMIRAAAGLAKPNRKVLYACAEMSGNQLMGYIIRQGGSSDDVALYVKSHLDVDEMIEELEAAHAKIVIVDSLHKCEFEDIDKEPGNPAQIKATLTMLTSYAKKHNVAFIVISHMNRDGGFNTSESDLHDVDVLLQLDGYSTDYPLSKRKEKVLEDVRVLSIAEGKNRQGSNKGVAMLQMSEEGVIKALSEAQKKVIFEIDIAEQEEDDKTEQEQSRIVRR